MSKLRLLNILKEEVTEQGYGRYFKDWKTSDGKTVGDTRGFDFTTNKPFDKDYKNPETEVLSSDNEDFSIDSTFLIKPSTKRNSPFNQVRGTKKDGTPKLHKGIDYGVSVGTLVVLIKPGVVLRSGMNLDPGGYGALIEIQHEDGVISRYGHMSEIYVSDGDKINSGEIIGATGGASGSVGAGNSQGPHLHFEYRVGGTPIDPASSDNDNSIYRFMSKSDKPKLEGGVKDTPVNTNNPNAMSEKQTVYILGKKMSIDKNGPKNHQSRALGNWQSDNATDIFSSPGTTVHSITKGIVKKIAGNQNKHNGKIYGANVTVSGTDGYPDIFYTHMQNIKVTKGQVVGVGSPIGEISKWEDNPSGSHVHVGLPYGEKLSDLIDLNTGKSV